MLGILTGLRFSDDYSTAEVSKNYKKLMQRNHPDSDGSEYLAAKINEARNILTKV